jgi:pyridoxamine 5'-phosphate oxidase-like protein
MERLSEAEPIRLLGNVAFGRIVFTQRALPAIRPANHVVVDGSVIIRTHLGATMLLVIDMVVAYEADLIDPDDQARYAALLEPWIDRQMDYTVRVVPELVTGYAMVDGTVDEDSAGDDRWVERTGRDGDRTETDRPPVPAAPGTQGWERCG